MGKHSTSRRPRAQAIRAAAAAGLVGAGTLGPVGVGHAVADQVLAEGTPCTITARACVSLATQQAWLIEDGTVVRGPVPVSSGGPGHETPLGDFRVEWKHKDHRSAEFNNAPMPWAVFFAPGGIAFHQGNLATPSAGCVRLAAAEAEAFYRFLQVNDSVQVR
ncbi:L,D-transpeptidase [Pseudonocardia hispaniensis]|uniref:L,D-transpeptidase n=1 Tax=Pseudonocardia hispaniensis TaxID=904933 RepID=A0ABW1IXH3_9PSEU